MLVEGLVSDMERDRFLNTVQKLPNLSADELSGLNVEVDSATLDSSVRDNRGIF